MPFCHTARGFTRSEPALSHDEAQRHFQLALERQIRHEVMPTLRNGDSYARLSKYVDEAEDVFEDVQEEWPEGDEEEEEDEARLPAGFHLERSC